ncbi:MAG: GNAT family N-acetyltransferase [Verrucomicrobia bacterium]|nr:GNAT family N-acetyltransferase [Verrucomicrobiota bacterium]
MIKFKFTKPGSKEYEAERMLRWEILRKPLGMPPGSEWVEGELDSLHFLALEKKEVVGCVCFHPEDASSGLVFGMALSDSYQGKGFGRQFLHAFEEQLAQKGVHALYVHARPEVEEFFQQMGYAPEGELTEQVGIPHRLMCKKI